MNKLKAKQLSEEEKVDFAKKHYVQGFPSHK
jgi:hypothetical protein